MTRSPLLAKLLTVALGGGVLVATAVVRAPTIPDAPAHVDLDGSAFTSLAYRLDGGSVSGRDFEHTYGILGQGLTWLAVRLQNKPEPASSLPLILVVFWALNVLLLGVLLLLVPAVGWREAAVGLLLLTSLDIPYHYPSFRPLAAMIAVAVMARACCTPTRVARIWLAAAAAVSCCAAQLLTAEAGAYALAAAAGAPLLLLVSARRQAAGQRRADMESLAVLATATLALQVGLAWILAATSPSRGLFDYHRGTLRVMRGYALALGHEWVLPRGQSWALAIAAGLTLGIAFRRSLRADALNRRLLSGLVLLSLFQAKGVLTRSDVGHVLLGMTPLVVLWALLLRDWERPRLPSAAWLVAMVALMMGWPGKASVPWGYVTAVLSGRVSVAAAWREARRFRIAQDVLLPVELLRIQPRGDAPVLVLPFQNHLGVVLRRPLVGGVHQAYSAYTLDLQRELLAAITRAGPSVGVIYGLDGVATGALDDVDVPTRLPLVFEHLLENFRADPPVFVARGYFALGRRPEARPLARQPLAAVREPSSPGGTRLRLMEPATCGLVELAVRVRYPWWLPLGRAATLAARFSRHGNVVAEKRVLPLTSDGLFPALLSFAPPAELYRAFSEGLPAGTEWDALEMGPVPTDAFGVTPRALEVVSACCVG